MNGFILLDKPIGVSSNHILQKVKRLLKIKKMGHTGTLDPLASGMLPIACNAATRFCQYLIDANKTYEVAIKLGAATATADAEGEIIETKPVPELSKEIIEKELQKLIGEIEQIPPLYSAVKYQGKPLYSYARRGMDVPRQPRTVKIFEIQLIDFFEADLVLRVTCGKGTYIRTLAEMIGENLGTVAYVNFLKRLSVGDFKEDEMVSIEAIEQSILLNQVEKILIPTDRILQKFPKITVNHSQKQQLFFGQTVDFTNNFQNARVYDEQDQFFGLVEAISQEKIKGKTLITPEQIA